MINKRKWDSGVKADDVGNQYSYRLGLQRAWLSTHVRAADRGNFWLGYDIYLTAKHVQFEDIITFFYVNGICKAELENYQIKEADNRKVVIETENFKRKVSFHMPERAFPDDDWLIIYLSAKINFLTAHTYCNGQHYSSSFVTSFLSIFSYVVPWSSATKPLFPNLITINVFIIQ